MTINTNLSFNSPTIYNEPFSQGAPGIGMSASALDAQVRSKLSGGVASLQFPGDLPKYYMTISLADFGGYQTVGGGAGSVIQTFSGSITLPMPMELVDKQDVEYTTYNFGPLLGTAANLPGVSDAVRAGVNQPINQSVNQATDALKNATANGVVGALSNAGAPLAQGAAAQLGSPLGLTQAYEAFTGVAINQFYTILLKGPTYKRYEFSWDLVPRDQSESTSIRNIVLKLRKGAAPGLTPNRLFWTFPQIATCSFMPYPNDNSTYLYRFKPAVMTSVTANFAPGSQGFSAYKSTAPESVRLTVNFLELEYWLNSDYR